MKKNNPEQMEKILKNSANEEDHLKTDPCLGSPKERWWTSKQNQKYVLFLKENKKALEDEKKKRLSKIYLEMSLNMGEKTPEQCRTHHLKALKKYQSIQRIISLLMRDLEQKEKRLQKKEDTIIEETSAYKIIWNLNNTFKISLGPSFFKEI